MSKRYPGHFTRKMNKRSMRFNKTRRKAQIPKQRPNYIPSTKRIRDVRRDAELAKLMAKDIEYKANNPGLGLSFTVNIKKLYKLAQKCDNIAGHYLRQNNQPMWFKFRVLAEGYRLTALTLILAYNPKAPPDIIDTGAFPLSTVKAPAADHEVLVKWQHPITKPPRSNKPVYTRKQKRRMNKMARKSRKLYNT